MGVKYFLNYFSRLGNEFRIEINIPNYNGERIEVLGVEDSEFHLSTAISNTPFDDFINTLSASISVYSDNIDVKELQLMNDLECKIDVFKNNKLYYTGCLIADGLTEKITSRGAVIALTTSDNLKQLEGKELILTNPPSPIVDGVQVSYRSPINYFRQLFNMVGSVLPINWHVSTLNQGTNAFAGLAEWSPRGEIIQLNSMNAWVILSEMAKSLTLKVYQQNGEWWVINESDVIREGGVVEVYRIAATMEEVTATKFNKSFNTEVNEILEDLYSTVIKSVGKVEVTYSATRDENIVPNGDFEHTSSGSPLYWEAVDSELGYTTIANQTISIRGGNSLEFTSFKDEQNAVTFGGELNKYYIPLDCKTLFKSLTFGFTFMPEKYPTYLSPPEKKDLIAWLEKMPLKYQVTYTANGNLYYLNENGYWNTDRGESLKYVSTTDINKVNFSGVGRSGQSVIFFFQYGGREAFTVPLNRDFNTTRETLEYIASQAPIELGAVAYDSFITFRVNAQTSLAARIDDTNAVVDNFIPVILNNVMNGDINLVTFQSKGNEGRILMPKPDSLDNFGEGLLSIKFIQIGENAKTTLDDVYINVENAFDVYELDLVNNKNATQKYDMKISSSFSGCDLSSYMNNFSNTNEVYKFERNGISASLTEHFGRDVLSWREKPLTVLEGSFQGDVNLGAITTLYGIKYIVFNKNYNSAKEITKLNLVEAHHNNNFPNVVHKSSLDNKIS